MKLTLEFDTSKENDDPETLQEYLHAPQMRDAILKADDVLRTFYKEGTYSEEAEKVIQQAREALWIEGLQ